MEGCRSPFSSRDRCGAEISVFFDSTVSVHPRSHLSSSNRRASRCSILPESLITQQDYCTSRSWRRGERRSEPGCEKVRTTTEKLPLWQKFSPKRLHL